MKYINTAEAEFISRPNRFIANVNLNGKTETVHVKNTGRCKELLIPGCRVILCKGTNPNRKTEYDLIAVYKNNLGWVNIDSQIPNKAVEEWLKNGGIQGITKIEAEHTYGKSRIDFYCETEKDKILLEVKGCTLEIDGKGYFPDAPTERGVKHLYELAKAVKEGYKCYLAFVIAMPGITKVYPNLDTDPKFGEALEYAQKCGVEIIYLPCDVTENTINIIK